MDNPRISSRLVRRMLIMMLWMFGASIIWITAREAMRARQQGLDIAASVSIALHFLPRSLPVVFGFVVAFCSSWVLVLRH